jgi:CheY-like chemotaxis protein
MVYPPIQTILLADDNPDDCELIKEAWTESPIGDRLQLVENGTELLEYLCRRGAFQSPETFPRPSVILLDLNMPGMSGAEVLIEIKQDAGLACIPIVVLTTSKAPKDIFQTAGLGVNGYMQKPNTFAGYLQILNNLREHWGEILDRPLSGGGAEWSGNVAWC